MNDREARFRLLNQRMSFGASFTEHDLADPFTPERGAGRFGVFSRAAVYTFDDGNEMEVTPMAEKKNIPANAHKGGRYERVYLRMTSDEKERLKAQAEARELSITDYIVWLVENDKGLNKTFTSS